MILTVLIEVSIQTCHLTSASVFWIPDFDVFNMFTIDY